MWTMVLAIEWENDADPVPICVENSEETRRGDIDECTYLLK
jgi:hypothetical protein